MIKNIVLIGVAILISAAPLVIHRSAPPAETTDVDSQVSTAGEEAKVELFSGADDQAEKMIGQISPKYEPWFKPLWEPPSGEIECMLFALQAALGAGVFFYYLGYVRGRART
ncbi:MAG: energy-coupling factor ABC transporter substrate-binding protein [Planctomycetota bacterium]